MSVQVPHSDSERQLRRRKRKSRPMPLLRVVFVLVLMAAVVYAGMQVWNWYRLEQESQQLLRREQQLQQEQAALMAEKAKYEDPQYIEKEAREKLGLVKEKEVPYIR